MKKNGFLGFGILMVLLAMGFVLTGCPNDTTGEQDTWSNVTSLDQMNGTWKGSYSQTQTMKEMVESQGETWDETTAAMVGDMKVTTSVDITMTVNANAKTQTTAMTMTMTFSGGNIATVWEMLKLMMGSGSGVTVNDEKHSIIMTQNQPAEPITDADWAEMVAAGIQTNQNGTKIKVPAGTMGDNPELIFNKQ